MSKPVIRRRNRIWPPSAANHAPPPRSASDPGSASEPSAPPAEPAYSLGRGHPPMHTRFGAPGGNKPGRKKGSKNRQTILNEELNAKILVDGKRVEKIRVGMRQLANSVAKGDPKFLLPGLKLGLEYDPARKDHADVPEVSLTGHERTAFDIMKEMFGAADQTLRAGDVTRQPEGEDDE